ncbi:MAG: polysaccharide ABC transporter ATP-binding protein [Oricola sp.]
MTADGPIAISFQNVTKRYRLGGGPRDQLLEALGLSRFRRVSKAEKEFLALDGVNFDVKRGQRIGLIGRNGAGKTTLLKLISGNYKPTEGRVAVNGSVQALMTMGQGFHPDYTGAENIRASLHYNGLSTAETREAFDDIVEFCELGPFLEQPFKTYSSGMQARVMFATATAVKPDILVIDEVLGAGDAYFIAKSRARVENIVGSGCTLLLVSHSMGQVLELCEEAIWLDGGRVKMAGKAFDVVKAYEGAMYGAMPGSGDPSSMRRRAGRNMPGGTAETGIPGAGATENTDAVSTAHREAIVERSLAERTFALQLPSFQPHAASPEFDPVPANDARLLRNAARGGISRWDSEEGIKVVGFTVSGPKGPSEKLVCLQPALFTIFLEAERDDDFSCTYGIAIHDLQGRAILRLFSQPDHFSANAGEGRRVEVLLNPNQLGPGVYTVGISVLEGTTLENANSAIRYDLLSRSFTITVELPDSLASAAAEFFHSCEWSYGKFDLPAPSREESGDSQSIETRTAGR